MLKKTKIMKNSGLFLNMAKWYFLGVCFFWGFTIRGFVFGVFGIFSKVLKMLVFPSFFGFFWGWLIVVHVGLEGLGVFVFFVFVFLSCLAFVSVLFDLLLVLWLDVVVFFVCFFVAFCFCLFLFVFFGGFKGHVRWPEGPPHLALNPPYFICFCFFPLFCFLLLFFLFFCLFFWRV